MRQVANTSATTHPIATGNAGPAGLLLHVHVPSALLGAGIGATAPIIPLVALDHGASVAVAGLVTAAGGLGTVLADLPAGRLVVAIGERGAITVASLIGVAGVAFCLADVTLAVLVAGVLLVGLAQAVWGLARQSYLSVAVPPSHRGRAISAMAGMHRLGNFVGPFIGAAAVSQWHFTGAFAVQLVTVVVAGVLMATLPDDPRADPPSSQDLSLSSVLMAQRRPLCTLGAGACALGALRASRLVVLPLWADHVGVPGPVIALLFGVAGAVDVAVSYPAGIVMDRFGRRATALPAMSLFAGSLIALPAATTVGWIGALAVTLGLANGLTNGLVMTIGTDIAPPDARAQFLSAWRLMHDAGACAGPAALAGVAAVAGLGPGAAVLGAVAAAGGGVFATYLPRRSRPTPAHPTEPVHPTTSATGES
ncbi:MFS transporter [Gordonia hankookensis]|uniref:MFS transporter n=1 Tax=Gordonia hankookensis TaxID=589403 RepID=A0ABR7W7K5_9ACTN|nr:MFS transporter [Gordonia hankookensis]MBD1318738.1 MFS transporter [Gordonia hankookensis]